MDAKSLWRKSASGLATTGEKTVTVTKLWSEAYSLFLKVEADLVLSYTTFQAYHLIKEKRQLCRCLI